MCVHIERFSLFEGRSPRGDEKPGEFCVFGASDHHDQVFLPTYLEFSENLVSWRLCQTQNIDHYSRQFYYTKWS